MLIVSFIGFLVSCVGNLLRRHGILQFSILNTFADFSLSFIFLHPLLSILFHNDVVPAFRFAIRCCVRHRLPRSPRQPFYGKLYSLGQHHCFVCNPPPMGQYYLIIGVFVLVPLSAIYCGSDPPLQYALLSSMYLPLIFLNYDQRL